MKKVIIASIFALAFALGVDCHAGNGKRTESLKGSLWDRSEWISASNAPVRTGTVTDENCRAADGSSWFVSLLRNRKQVKRAVWMTTGLGVYDLYINGELIGDDFLKPGFTHHAKTKRSFTYDVTDAIYRAKDAENVFSARVTPGWWADKIVTPSGHEGMIGKKPAFRAVLELTYTDGTKQYLGTNTKDWKAGVAGPITHSGIFDGEEYDDRIQQGHKTPDKLGKPERNIEYQGEILPSKGGEVCLRTDLALEPTEIYSWKGVTGSNDEDYGTVVKNREYAPGEEILLMPGETLVVDFGQNCSAVPYFEFKARTGTELVCRPAELLNDGNGSRKRGMDGPEGSVHRLNLRIPDTGMMLKYTFADRPDFISYNPRTSFYGYRYLSVTADRPVCIRAIKSIPVTSLRPEMETGRIITGNELVNKLISNTVWGMRSNYLSVPTDCPQRNERLGWTADTQVFSETGTYFADTKDFFHKWMRDMRDTQTETGAFPGVAPLAQYGAYPTDMMRLGWADAGVIVPWVVWKQFGDTDIIDENWGAMEKFLNHMAETEYCHESLLAENGDYQWADWLSYEPLESCGGGIDLPDGKGRRPEARQYWNYLSSNYWLMDAEMMSDMAKATGRDHTRYDEMAAKARKNILDNFINDEGEFTPDILNTMQTPALFALKNKLVDGKAKENMIERLRKNFADHSNCLQTGFLGTSILMPTLTENGMQDVAYELLFQRKNPSWLYSVDNGATTIWERWNSYMLESGMGPRGMNSFNHYAYGCVCEWMWETMAGISADPAQPGFKHIIMKPIPDKRLGFVDATYNSASGTIKSKWRYEGDRCIWDFTIPEGTTASVYLPGDIIPVEYAPGTYTVEI